MKLKLMVVALLIAVGAQAQTYKYATVPGDATKTRIYTLDNGLKVYLSVNKEKPRLQANVVVKTGSRNDPAETTGLAHYLEHLMFKGTSKFGTTNPTAEKPYLDDITKRYEHYRTLTDPKMRKQAYHEIDSVSQLAAKYNIPNEYDKLMASIGSEGSNAYTSNDVTCYVENIPNNEIENWARIQSDRFQNMVIRGFHTELEAVYEEKNITMGSDMDKEFSALNFKLYPTHPYGTQTTIGEQEHLKNPSIINIMNYFHRYYVPNNVAITMAGDFDPDVVIRIIDKYFGSWKKCESLNRPEFASQSLLTAVKDTSVVGKDAENVILGWRFDASAKAQIDTLNLIDAMLANGKAGLLDLDLSQQMKVLGAGSFIDNMHDYTSFILEGMPNEGQRLEDVRALLLGELKKLAKGDFSDDLIPSVIANKKLDYYKSLDDNKNRTNMMVDAFINDKNWECEALQIQRLEKIKKQDVMNFAAKYLRDDNFVCVYKLVGIDSTQKKIEKPTITPIPANREYESNFVKEIKNTKVDPIQPQFLDFKKDLAISKTSKGLPLLYKKNTQDDLFTLNFRYEFGSEDDAKYNYAADYLNYIGTDKKTASEIKQAFYKLACDYSVEQGSHNTQISLTGLNENLPQALNLLEDLLKNAKADTTSWNQYVEQILKARKDAKTNQKACFNALYAYSVYGQHNSLRNILNEKELRSTNPQDLTALIKGLNGMKHEVIYYGPYNEKELNNILSQEHQTPKTLANVPSGKKYEEQLTQKNEIFIAPYEAKNIYMREYHNEGHSWNPENEPTEDLFNEYFGGGMNAIVFQELRETRGLAYNAWSLYFSPDTKGHSEHFVNHIISQNDKMMDCIKVFAQICDTLPQNESSFELAKQSLIKNIQAKRITKRDVINAYLSAKRLGIDYDINQKVYEALPNIQLKDIVKFANENIAKKTYRYIILGDENNLDIKGLEKIAPIKRLSLDEIFGY